MKKIFFTALIALANLYAAQSLTTLSVSGTYSEGDFDTDYMTKAYYVPVVGTYKTGRISTSITIPYVKLDSEGSVTWTDGGPVPINPSKPTNIGNAPANTSAFNIPTTLDETVQTPTLTDGLGDILLNVGYTFLPVEKVLLKTSAIMKVATGDKDKGLGTGEHDYSAQVDLSISQDKMYYGLSGGYTVTGDSQEYTYKDVFYSSLSAGYRIDKGFHSGVSYYYRQSLFEGVDDTHSLSPYMVYKFLDTYKIELRYSHGMSDSTADNAYTLKFIHKL